MLRFSWKNEAEAEAFEGRLPFGYRGIKEYLTLFWESFTSSPFSPAASADFVFLSHKTPPFFRQTIQVMGSIEWIKVAILLNS